LDVTEIRIRLLDGRRDRLRAYATITFDHEYVVRDLRIIEGTRGTFVAMPSRRLADRCPRCGGKNHLRANFCNECGSRLPNDRAPRDTAGRPRLHCDIAHPVHREARERIESCVLTRYQHEMGLKQSGQYLPPTDDEYELEEGEFEYE
jgi:stage V sporulation protein G